MFATLIETRRAVPSSPRGVIMSVSVHALVMAATVAATSTASAHLVPSAPEAHVIYSAPPESPARTAPTPPPATAAAALSTAPIVAPAMSVLPLHLPESLPEASVTLADPSASWTAHPAPGTTPNASSTGASTQGVWSAHTVERPVVVLDAVPPRYPELLRAAGVAGEVLAQFVVDTAGRVEAGSLRVVHSTHPLFTQAVERAIGSARFVPAEANGQRVRQLVQRPFAFAIAR